MKNEITIAFKNLLHNPGRTLLTLAIIMISLGSLLFVDGYVEMVRVGFAESLIRSEYGHFHIYPEGYTALNDPQDTTVLFSREEYSALQDMLYSMDDVESVLPRLPLSGMIGNSYRSTITFGIAGDPIAENTLARGELLAGSRLDPRSPGSAVIGSLMAESLEVAVGDPLIMTVPNPGGGLEAALVEVAGIADFGPEELNRSYMYINLEAGQQLHYTEGVQSLVVLLEETERTPGVMDELRVIADEQDLDIEMKEWQELALFYTQVIRDYLTQLRVVLVVVIVLGALAVSNTIHISVIQRIPEIGTLRAMGITNGEIILTVLFEGLFLGVLGSLLGVLFALGIQVLLNTVSIMLPPPPGTYEEIRLSIILTLKSAALYAGLFCLITLPAAVPPSIRGIRANIIDTLRS